MDFFKNLNQLENQYHLMGAGNLQVEFILNSKNKKATKDLKNLFPSFELKETENKFNHPILQSVEIPTNLFHVFAPYMKRVIEDNNRCLMFSSYTDEQLAELRFRDYWEHFNSCFIFHLKDSWDSDDYYQHKHNVMLDYAIGSRIFDSRFANINYPQQIYASVSNLICSFYHTDFFVQKSQMSLSTPVTLSRIGKDSLDEAIFEIVNLLRFVLAQESNPIAIFGYPSDMLKHYIKPSKLMQNPQNYQVIEKLIVDYILKKYKVSKDFCPKEEMSTQKFIEHIKDFSIYEELSRSRAFSSVHIYPFSIKEPNNLDFPQHSSYNVFEEFISNIVAYVWIGLSLHYTTYHMKQAFQKALSENKNLLTLKNERAYVNNSLTRKQAIDRIVASLPYDRDSIDSTINEMIDEEINDNRDLEDELIVYSPKLPNSIDDDDDDDDNHF